MFLGVDIDPAHENTVNRFEPVERLALPRPTPDRVAGGEVLFRREGERDVERDSGRRQFLQSAQPARRVRHFDHAVGMARTPFLAQLDVESRAFRYRQIALGVFDERVQLKADIAVVAVRRVPDRKEDLLRLAHEHVGHGPGNFLILEAIAEQLGHFAIETAGLDQVRDDDRVGSRSSSAPGTIACDLVRIDGIEPQLCSRSNEGLQRGSHDQPPEKCDTDIGRIRY